ncbi:MAG TPA: L-dopachrome tautomerase-related protein [Verrucomicrobiae bacterium]|nr:L-dopachrome tautomerase-related protein [Verrucomicrobiae bacterium]
MSGETGLVVVAESATMIWNAVAVYRGRIFVAGPRWSGSQGPALGELIDGTPQPYPDAAWNRWRDGDDSGAAFVNVNAIHLEGSSLWVVDTATPMFGGNTVANGAKIVQIDLATNRVTRVYALPSAVVKDGSYIDDIRINGRNAYLTDAGNAGILVLDLTTGTSRRVLDHHPATMAPPDRLIVVDGETVTAPDGLPLRVQSDPMELSSDGRWFFFGPLEGPWSKIETRFLDDATLAAQDVAAKVLPWADIPPIGGSAMAANGDFYFTDLNECALKRRDAATGAVTTLVRNKALHWVDAPYLDEDAGAIYLPVPQLDRAALFHHGTSKIEWPVRLYRFPVR